MHFKKWLVLLLLAGTSFRMAQAQIEGDYLSTKDFHSFGLGGYLNVSFMVTDANYLTLDVGLNVFHDRGTDEYIYLAPIVAGYRYTLDQSGTRWYVEPNAGYAFGDPEEIAGPTAGVTLGYIFTDSGPIKFNIGLRYQRGFGHWGTDMLALRISHNLVWPFGRRRRYY
jgi:hypothetical protein